MASTMPTHAPQLHTTSPCGTKPDSPPGRGSMATGATPRMEVISEYCWRDHCARAASSTVFKRFLKANARGMHKLRQERGIQRCRKFFDPPPPPAVRLDPLPTPLGSHPRLMPSVRRLAVWFPAIPRGWNIIKGSSCGRRELVQAFLHFARL